VYTYAFLNRQTTIANLPFGIAGSLQQVNTPSLSAVIEPQLDLERVQASDDRLVQAVLAHDRVIQHLFSQTVVLPLRFGTCFVSQAALLEHLHSHDLEYLTKLNTLANKAEYVLKAIPLAFSTAATPTELTGRDYFFAKKQRFQAQASHQQQQHAELDALHRSILQTYSDVVYSPTSEEIQRIYLLLPRSLEAELWQRVDQWQLQCQHWQLDVGEALPPYHFV
jgi:hypothetical protein